jgi:hypothetical protein
MNAYPAAADLRGRLDKIISGGKVMNVKGSIFISLIKAIKHDKSGAFNRYLTDKDRAFIASKILPSTWCPFDTYERCVTGVFEVVGKGNPDVARGWGRAECKAALTGIYSSFVEGRDPIGFIRDYEMVHKRFFDTSRIEVTVEGSNQVVFKLLKLDTRCVPIYHLIQGWLEQGLELCGAKNIQFTYLTKSWEGYPDTSMRITWT